MSEAIEYTIAELVQKCSNIDRIAAIFDAENVTFSFSKIHNEMNSLAAGLLSTGLQAEDRVLICGSNCSQFLISVLACCRAGLIFSLMNPNFNNAEQLKYALNKGEFRAIICFSANKENEFLNNLLNEIAPELRVSAKGHFSSKELPKLSHIIMAEEEHKHAGTFTLSEIYGRSNQERLEKLHNLVHTDPHKIAAMQFTTGVTAKPKIVALSHYQLLNGCLATATGINIHKDDTLCCALPMFKMAVFSLVGLLPFVVGTRVIFPSPSPLPKYLFDSVNNFRCTHLLSNAVALRLILKLVAAQKIEMPSITNIILAGERVPSELIEAINRHLPNTQNIISAYLLTETASMPIMTNDANIITKSIGKPLPEFQVDVVQSTTQTDVSEEIFGELRIKPVNSTKFIGYGPNFDQNSEWINTGDFVKQNKSGVINLIANKDDLIFDSNGKLIEHWVIEKSLCLCGTIKGAQIVKPSKEMPLTAIVVAKTSSMDRYQIKAELQAACKNNKLAMPEKFAFITDFPRVNTKIQKFRLRQMIIDGELEVI